MGALFTAMFTRFLVFIGAVERTEVDLPPRLDDEVLQFGGIFPDFWVSILVVWGSPGLMLLTIL